MTKPSDFSPAEALEVPTSSDAKQVRGTRWMLQIVGAGVLLVGWLAVSLRDIGQIAFVVDTIVFPTMALYAFTAAVALRSDAVKIALKPVNRVYHTQGLAMDIPEVSRRPGENVFKSEVLQS